MALDYLPSPSWAVIYGETPSATRWSELGENDDALATGAGIDNLAIVARHMAADSVSPAAWTNPYSFNAYASASPTTPINTFFKILYNTVEYDNGGGYSAANSQFVVPVAGIYNFSARWYNTTGSPLSMIVAFYVNGAERKRGTWQPSGTYRSAQGSTDIKLNAGDTVSIYGYAETNAALLAGSAADTWFCGHLVTPL